MSDNIEWLPKIGSVWYPAARRAPGKIPMAPVTVTGHFEYQGKQHVRISRAKGPKTSYAVSRFFKCFEPYVPSTEPKVAAPMATNAQAVAEVQASSPDKVADVKESSKSTEQGPTIDMNLSRDFIDCLEHIRVICEKRATRATGIQVALQIEDILRYVLDTGMDAVTRTLGKAMQ